jgi:nicotinate-nucleotide--dimethylbenzimidazole phosphoribosyltransferase
VVKGLVRARIAPGTADFTVAPAMTVRQCERAMMLGAKRAQHAAKRGVQALVLGEMGIGNTTSAAALMAAYLDLPPADCCGRGTGCDDAGLERKRAAVAAGLARLAKGRKLAEITPFGILAELGGLEIAAIAGAMLAAAAARVAVVVDGFICSAAALAALRIDPALQPYLVWSHCGSEQGHRRLLDAVGAKPLVALDLRLGEGTGGVLALHLLRAACRTLDEMATFAEAGVSGKA